MCDLYGTHKLCTLYFPLDLRTRVPRQLHRTLHYHPLPPVQRLNSGRKRELALFTNAAPEFILFDLLFPGFRTVKVERGGVDTHQLHKTNRHKAVADEVFASRTHLLHRNLKRFLDLNEQSLHFRFQASVDAQLFFPSVA